MAPLATDSVAAMLGPAASGQEGHIVLVPYHHGVDHLGSALRSLIAQTNSSWRAVIVDDSPADAPFEEDALACQQMVGACRDLRISYERAAEPLGVARAFNRCFELAAASGAAYATVLHADDELSPGYLDAVAATHSRHPSAACVAPRAEVIDALGRPSWPLADRVKAAMWPTRTQVLSGDNGLARLLHGQFLYCPSVSYRTDFVRRAVWDGRWGQVMDLDLFCRLLLDGDGIALCDQSVYRYRRHDDSTTSHNTANTRRLDEETRLCREIGALAARRGLRRAVWASRLRSTVRLHGLLQAVGACRHRDFRRARRLVVLSLGR